MVPCAHGQRCFFSRDPAGQEGLLLDYPLNTQEGMRACLGAERCPHQVAMRAAAEATVIVGDYNQMFGPGPNLLQRLGRREADAILIVDEAHNLPPRVMGAGSGSVSASSLARARSLPALKHFAEDLDLLSEVFSDLTRRDPEHINGADLDVPLRNACGVDAGGLAEEMGAAGEGNDLGGLVDFLRAWSAPDEVTVRYLEGEPARLKVSLIDPSPITAPVLARVRSALIMSGTLHPPEMFADLLGAKNAICRSYPSPFPPENRPVLASRKVSTRYRSRGQAMYGSIAEEIAQCAARVPGNVAAFFPSYELLGQVEGYLAALVGDRRILAERREHGKNEKAALVHQLLEGRNLLLGTVGGSLAEGVDFRDNLLGAVLVVGLPLAPPSLEMEGMIFLIFAATGLPEAARAASTNFPLAPIGIALVLWASIDVLRAIGAFRDERRPWKRRIGYEVPVKKRKWRVGPESSFYDFTPDIGKTSRGLMHAQRTFFWTVALPEILILLLLGAARAGGNTSGPLFDAMLEPA